MRLKKQAFTLAEVLIVLGVVGVVAALTLPTLISNVHDKVVERQIQVIQRKINQGTEGMQVRGALLENYPTTSAFIDELSKDMKIISKCDSDHLRDCWPYQEILIDNNGEDKAIDITTQKEGQKAFKMTTGDYAEVMGVVFGNGTPMMLAYDKKCTLFDPDQPYEVNKDTGMSATSACIAGVYDINGPKGPNKIGKDVVLFRAEGYGDLRDCWFTTSTGKCFSGMPFIATGEQAQAVGSGGACNTILSTKKYTDTNNLFGAGAGAEISVTIEGNYGSSCSYEKDYWLAAAVQCGAKGMRLPTIDELDALAAELYPNPTSVTTGNGGPYYTGTRTIPTNMQTSLSGLGSAWYLWSSSADNTYWAWIQYFDLSRSYRNYDNRKDNLNLAVCVAD